MKSAYSVSDQALRRTEGWKEVCRFHCQILHHAGCGRDQLFYQGKLEDLDMLQPAYCVIETCRKCSKTCHVALFRWM